jgi:hypothetical protein
MSDKTESGFPIGTVAQTLRKILYPALTEHQVEAIMVLLISHLLIEQKINHVLSDWLKQDAPCPPEKAQEVLQAENSLWETIVRMNFSNKFSLLKPFLAIDFDQDVKHVKQINELRNTVFHGRDIEGAKFQGKSIFEGETIERIFLKAQEVGFNLNKFSEMVDSFHAYAEKNAKELAELKRNLTDESKSRE